MINVRYKLISPKQIVEEFVDEHVNDNELVVRPKYLSICAADQRYYQGSRDKKVLNQKLPLALIHEAIGEIVFSNDEEFKVGDSVVMLPNIHENSSNNLKENYDTTSKFRGSSCDGFMQNNVVCRKQNVIKIEKDQIEVVFLELMSVVFNALDSFENELKLNNNTIAVYGDGSLGYITSLILRKKFPNSKIIVIGKNKDKLDYFTFITEKYTIDKIPSDVKFDHAFECVGGIGSAGAIDSIIEKINPQGIVNLLGVSEYAVNINTRMVLEKGLRLIGNSRSSYNDFKNAVDFIEMYPDTLNYLSNIVSNVIDVKSINDINTAFMMDATNKFKTVMKWDV